MDIIKLIQERKSWRTYKEEKLDNALLSKIKQKLTGSKQGPLGNTVNIYFFSRESTQNQKLGTYGIVKNAKYFLGADIIPEQKSFLDFGYLLEQAVLELTQLELGTCWLGGTFTKSNFREAADIDTARIMPAVIALGDPKTKRSIRDKLISFNAGSSKRKSWDKLFFANDIDKPLAQEDLNEYATILEMVRLAPSASNLQPWRIIQSGHYFHFFLKRKVLYNKIIKNVDLQMIDMGIAMYHFAATANQLEQAGEWQHTNPKIDKNWEYIISWKAETKD